MIKINPVSGYISRDNKSKYSYELSRYKTGAKCKCGLCSNTINVYPDGKEIAMHITMKGCYWHICVPGQKIRRVFKCPDEFEFDKKIT